MEALAHGELSHYVCLPYSAHSIIAILPVFYIRIMKSALNVHVGLNFSVFLLSQHRILLRSAGQSGSEETALVIIHLSIFSHALLHYSHPSICSAIRVCHSNELQLASPVIITWAVLPFLTAFFCHAKLTLKTGKVPFKCHSFSKPL